MVQEKATLFDFQKDSVSQLLHGKKFIISGTGCLAGDTTIPMAYGGYKAVRDLSSGEAILSYDENKKEFVVGEVDCVIRTCHKPKPMIQLEYDGEKITTTYDHPFFNGEGYYPLYQLIWGALETSQRVQLELLCKQYGQTFDDKAIWCKHCGSNEACVGQQWVLQDNDGWQDGKSTSDSGRELAGKPCQLGLCKPFRLQPGEQQSGKPRVVFKKVQCLVGDKKWHDGEAHELEKRESPNTRRTGSDEKFLQQEHTTIKKQLREEEIIRQDVSDVSQVCTREDNVLGDWKVKIKTPEPYYTVSMRRAPYTYCIGRKHYFMTHNSGKSAIAMKFAEMQCLLTGKKKVLVVTTASKCKARTSEGLNDFEDEAKKFCSPEFFKTLSQSLTLLSWHKLAKWKRDNWKDVNEYVIIWDEVAKASAGWSSGMGRAFLGIASKNKDWAAFTATPGDTWLKFYPYFVVCDLEYNKTSFLNNYANVQTFKGYPEIIGWRNEDKLKRMWAQISYAPDTNKVMSELPEQTHRVITFSKPKDYFKTLKTRYNANGEFLDTAGALCAELRRLCFTKDKQEWIKDFVEGLESGCVFFYNFIKTGDMLQTIIEKALPKGARVWRIDGKHHEIPTAETIGPNDMVLCQWQSGSEGLNLHFLHYMVIVEANYSYSLSIQGRGRIRRIGQKMPQFYYYLKTEGTIEDAIYKALATKSDFADDVWLKSQGINIEESND